MWARIRSDLPSVPPPFFNTSAAFSSIHLDEQASCCCQVLWSTYDLFQPTLTKECIVYRLTSVLKTMIEVQNCPTCKNWYIGPDCQSIGLFNWNNRTLLTYELLDNYTNQFTTSETPFIAWVTVVSRWYEARNASIPFINDQLFCTVWFSYICLV